MHMASQIQRQNEDDIMRKVVELEEEKRRLQGKLKQVERKNDHFQRALRLAEIPKLLEDRENRKTTDREYFYQHHVCVRYHARVCLAWALLCKALFCYSRCKQVLLQACIAMAGPLLNH